jgi:hypothetical protein
MGLWVIAEHNLTVVLQECWYSKSDGNDFYSSSHIHERQARHVIDLLSIQIYRQNQPVVGTDLRSSNEKILSNQEEIFVPLGIAYLPLPEYPDYYH